MLDHRSRSPNQHPVTALTARTDVTPSDAVLPAEPAPPARTLPRVPDRGRRGFLAAASVALGAGVAATATACASSPQRATEVEVTARSIAPRLSTAAGPQENTDALNAALADSVTNGADVVLPGGEYQHFGVALPVSGRVNVVGAGRGVTVLRNMGTEPSISVPGEPGDDTYLSSWAISGLTLATGERGDQVGLSVRLASLFSVRDIDITDHGTGVRHESSWDCGYDGVSVGECGIGWLFPTTDFAPSAPVSLRNCSAWNCETSVLVEGAVEALEWVGGDFAGSGRGLSLFGADARNLSFHGINFERIRGEDVVVGDDVTGPAAVTISGCRFLREDSGLLSVRYVRGDALTITSSRWTNYGTAVEAGPNSGQLVVNASTGFEVDHMVMTAQQELPQGVLTAALGQFSMLLSVEGPSQLPAVVGTEGVATKVISGPGRRTVSDEDFAMTPAPGWTCVVRNETDGSIRHGIRGVTGWFVSAPYFPSR